MHCELYTYRKGKFICQMDDCGRHEDVESEMWRHLRTVHFYEVQPGLFDEPTLFVTN